MTDPNCVDLILESDEETHAKGNDGTFFAVLCLLLNRDSTREMSFSNGHVLGFFLLLLLLLLSTLVF